MDETIFYIVIFVIYLIFQAIGGKKKKKKRPSQGPVTTIPTSTSRPAAAPGAEPTLEDALREIRQALGMETPAQTAAPPQAAPPPPPPPRPKPRPKTKPHPVRSHGPELADLAPKKSWPSEFKAPPRHFADSDFEEFVGEGDRFGQPRTKTKLPRLPAKVPPVKPPIIQPTQPASTPVSRSEVMNQLKDPKAARDAFVLSEILGPPRSQKRL